MGQEQSKLEQEGYVTTKTSENYIVATKDNDTIFIKMIPQSKLSKEALEAVNSEIETLKRTSHPHIVNVKESFKDENQGICYVVMDHCQGGNLADKIRNMPPESPKEFEVLSWIAEICMALKTIHEAGLFHKDLTPRNVLFTEFGIVRLGGFGNIHENSTSQITSNSKLNYQAPEVFAEDTYDAKSDIWSVGCILYEMCKKQQAFSAETTVKLIPKIIKGDNPLLPAQFSLELRNLLSDLLKKDPEERPKANEILAHPIVLRCLMTKCKTTVEHLHLMLDKLRTLADGLERVHKGATIGSLTGGVIGAVGGITSIVGLILAPFTLGASLIVTGVGVGIGAVGGVTAGAANITNMVNQSSDRKAIHNLIKEFEQKTSSVVTWLLEIKNSLETINSMCPDLDDPENNINAENLSRLGLRAGRGLSGIAELIRLVTVLNIGRIATQAARAVRVAEVATGIFSGLFVAVDVFFIAMDAKEIHHIKKAKEAERADAPSTGPGGKTGNSGSASDQAEELPNSELQECDAAKQANARDESVPNRPEIRSEIMKFVMSIRDAAGKLERVLDELDSIVSSLPSIQGENEDKWLNAN